MNQNDNLIIRLDSIHNAELSPGELVNLPLTIAGANADGLHNVLMKVTVENNEVFYVPLFVRIIPEEKLYQPDLAVMASDIQIVNHTDSGPATLAITVHNNDTAIATNVPLTMYHFNNLITTSTINSIAAGAAQTIQITIPVVTSGEHLIRVLVDSLQTIDEFDKTNNEANRIIKIGGQSVYPGGILVTASTPKAVYTDALFTITGRTMYDVVVDGIRYLDFPVKGGAITLTVSDNAGHSWIYGGDHSTNTGDYSKCVQAPAEAGVYTVTITATDQTFSGSRTMSFTVVERPIQPVPSPLPPSQWVNDGNWTFVPLTGSWEWTLFGTPSVPIPQQDISVYSENIHFSNNNPAQGEITTIATEINYWATNTLLNASKVPFNLNVTRPGSEKVRIGSAIIDRLTINAPENGSRFVYVDWKNSADGVYIVEAEIDPSYLESNMKNNAATRAIIVGEYKQNCGVLSGQVIGPEGGIQNVGIELYDDYGMLRYTTTTDNGFYLIDTLRAGTYTVKCVIPAGYVSDTVSREIRIVSQEVTTANFHLYLQTTPLKPDVNQLSVLSGECSVNIADVPTAKDFAGNMVNGTTADPHDYSEQGTYTVNWLFTDANGCTTLQTQLVIVKDNTAPAVGPLPVITSECSVIISTPPTAIDNCAGTITGTTSSPLPLHFDHQGTFVIIWTFDDGHGNPAMKSATGHCCRSHSSVSRPSEFTRCYGIRKRKYYHYPDCNRQLCRSYQRYDT